MGIGQECFGAIRIPFHRSINLAASPAHHQLFGVDENLSAKAATHIGTHYPELVLRCELIEGRKDESMHMGILGGDVQGDLISTGVIFTQRSARLHRVRHHAVIDQVEF